MINLLIGSVESLNGRELTLLNNGIGYLVNLGSNISVKEGDDIKLFIHMNVNDNEISLWGFDKKVDMDLFRLLMSVSGIGCKTASNLIYLLGTNEVVRLIKTNNYKDLKISGIGEKTAQKIILELSDKLVKFSWSSNDIDKKDTSYKNQALESEIIQEAKEALKQLGYNIQDIQNVLDSIDLATIASSKDIIKLALINI